MAKYTIIKENDYFKTFSVANLLEELEIDTEHIIKYTYDSSFDGDNTTIILNVTQHYLSDSAKKILCRNIAETIDNLKCVDEHILDESNKFAVTTPPFQNVITRNVKDIAVKENGWFVIPGDIFNLLDFNEEYEDFIFINDGYTYDITFDSEFTTGTKKLIK